MQWCHQMRAKSNLLAVSIKLNILGLLSANVEVDFAGFFPCDVVSTELLVNY